jgi:hypothetical protein
MTMFLMAGRAGFHDMRDRWHSHDFAAEINGGHAELSPREAAVFSS